MQVKSFFLTLLLALILSRTSADSAPQLSGNRFRCDEPSWVLLCLEMMDESCHLAIVPGRGLPRESSDRAVVVREDEAHVVRDPDALLGCVHIKSENEALEYLRFFSSYSTVYLFREQILEIFPSNDPQCFAVCISIDRWKKLGFKDPMVRKVEGGFEVSRTVITPTARIPEVASVLLVQRVDQKGRVVEVSRTPLELPEDLRLRLAFPAFM